MRFSPVLLVPVLIAIIVVTAVTYAVPSSQGNGGYQGDPSVPHPVPRVANKDGTSENWGGYGIQTNLGAPQVNAVTDVKGSWVVPAVDCTVTPTGYSSLWIGIDGYSSNTVEQIGTDSDCSSGTPHYSAWYEIYPKASKNVNMAIRPGDVMIAEVQYLGSGSFLLSMTDLTTGASFSTTEKSNKAERSSAEWVAEAPSTGNNKVLNLADYGTAYFTSAQATLNGHTGTISDPAWQNDAVLTQYANGTVKAMPSPLSSDGSAFSVSWMHQ